MYSDTPLLKNDYFMSRSDFCFKLLLFLHLQNRNHHHKWCLNNDKTVFLYIFCLSVSIKLFDKISQLLIYKYRETLIF